MTSLRDSLTFLGLLCCVLCLLTIGEQARAETHVAEEAVQTPLHEGEIIFLAAGRQGYGDSNTEQVAVSMETVARERGRIDFAVLLGDNFYSDGVSSETDPQWQSKFEDLYDGPLLRQTSFFAIFGNHDHYGNTEAQVLYARQKLGSGRWQIDAPYYTRDFGTVDGRPLVRVVFLDSVRIKGVRTLYERVLSQFDKPRQISFMRKAFQKPGPEPIWRIVASHYPFRSTTNINHSRDRVMSDLLPLLKTLDVDLVLSANDRFQQILDVSGEPLHVSTNGGGGKLEKIKFRDAPSELTLGRRGFALVDIDEVRIQVELYDQAGANSHKRVRRK